MPTSSQAMILRGSETIPQLFDNCKLFQYNAREASFREPIQNSLVENLPDRCELVQFGHSIDTLTESSLQDFEGVLAYDMKTNSYKWQMAPLSQRIQDSPKSKCYQEGGDFKNFTAYDKANIVGNEPLKIFKLDSITNKSVEGFGLENFIGDQQRRSPLCSDQFETSYLRLEKLGFRRINGYGHRGVHPKPSSLKLPQKCSSYSSTFLDTVSKLSVRNFDSKYVPMSCNISYKGGRFNPSSTLSAERSSKRVPPAKQKTLLEELKSSVKWANRVAPAYHHKSGEFQYLPNAVCFSLRDSYHYSHKDIKYLLETQLNCQVRSLRYDPISVRVSDTSVLNRWIVTFNSISNCEKAIDYGLVVDGYKVIIRAWNDLLKDEQNLDRINGPCEFRLGNKQHDRVIRTFLKRH